MESCGGRTGAAGRPLVANFSYSDLEGQATSSPGPTVSAKPSSKSQRSLIDAWQNTTPRWVIDAIFAIVCGELLFLLLLPWLENGPSSLPPWKPRHARQCPLETKRRSRSRKKACRVCLQELEKARELITLLRSHLGRPPDLGGFRQLCCQDPPGEVYDTAPEGAHPPCGEPVGDAAPATSPPASPGPRTLCPLPLDSTLSPGRTVSSVSCCPQASPSASRPPGTLPLEGLPSPPPALSHSPPRPSDSEAHPLPPAASSVPPPPDTSPTAPWGDSVALPRGPVPHSSRPGHPGFTSPSPAISGVGQSSCPVRALSWRQMTVSALCLSASSPCESQQEPPSHRRSEASLREGPTDGRAGVGGPSSVHPGAQKLLQTLPPRTAAPERGEEKKQEGSGSPLNSLGNERQSRAAGPDTDRGAPRSRGSDGAGPGHLILPALRERLEQHLRRRWALRQHRHEGGLPCRVQLSMELTQPGRQLPGRCPAQAGQGPGSPSGPAGQGGRDPGRARLGCPARSPPAAGRDEDMVHNVGRILRGICSGLAGLPVKVLDTSYEKSGADVPTASPRVPDKHAGGVRWDRRLGPMTAGQTPAEALRSRLLPSHALEVPGQSGAPVSPKGGQPPVNAPHAFPAPGPHTRPETPKKLRGRSRGGLALKVLKPVRLFKLTKGQRAFMLQSLFTCPSVCVHRAQLRANAAKFPAEPAPSPPREKVIEQPVPPLAGPLPAPSPACEGIQRTPGGTPPGDRQEPAKAPPPGQEGRLPSRPLTYVSVGRAWHRETAPEAGTGTGGRGSRPASAATRKASSTRSAGRTSDKSLRDVTTVEVDAECPSPRAEEAREVVEVKEVSDREVTSEPHVPAKPRTVDAARRRSRSPGPSTSPSPSTVPVPRAPGEPCVDSDAQRSDREVRELLESEERPPGPATGVLLEACDTGQLLRNFPTDTLPGDCRADAFLAADFLASQRSPFGSQSLSSGDLPASRELHDPVSSGGSCQWGSLGRQDPRRSRSGVCVPTARSGGRRRPGRAGRSSRASGLSSSPSSGSRSCPPGRRRRAPPGRRLRRRARHVLALLLPRKGRGRGREGPPQDGPRAAAAARSWDSLSSRSAGAPVLMTAVSHSVEEKITVHQGLPAPPLNWHRGEPQAPGGPRLCQHRVLRYEEQRVTQDVAEGHPAIRSDCSGFNEGGRARDRIGKWAFAPREPGAPGRPGLHEPRAAGPAARPRHCPRHCPFRRYVSCGQPDCAGHGLPCRTFLQRESHTLQRETVVCRAVSPPSLPTMLRHRVHSRGLGPLCAGYCGVQGRGRT